MSAGREQNDSDGSWTWVDNEEDNFRKRAETRRASSYERAQIEEIHDVQDDPAQESDISILTDPEDHPDSAAENVVEGTPLGTDDLEKAKQHFKQMAAEMQTAAAVKAALDVARPGESELAVTERRVRSYFRSTLTSAGFIIGGLLIATYCQWGCDSNNVSPLQEYYDRPYEDHDVEFIQPDFRGRYSKKHGGHMDKDSIKYAAQAHKNAKEKYEDERPGQRGGKRKHDDRDDYVEHHDKKQKRQKGDSKHKKDKHYDSHERKDYKEHKAKKGKHPKGHDDNHEDKENVRPKDKRDKHEKEKYQEHYNKKNDAKKHEKHEKNDKHQEHEDYLYKKEAYLKQKETKLKQKEYKLYAKDASNEKFDKRDKHEKRDKHDKHDKHEKPDKKQKKPKFNKNNDTSSGEWYDNMAKGRKDKRRQDEQAEWVFDRAQGRDKKRDKAHWYFDMMDERETNRVKKS